MRYKKDILLSSQDASISEQVVRVFEPIYSGINEILQYDPNSGLMSHAIDINRDQYDERVRAYRPYAVWNMVVDDCMEMRVRLPYPLNELGYCESFAIGDAKHRDAVIHEIKQFTNTPPLFAEKAKVRVIDVSRDCIYTYEAMARWSTYMKPVSCIMSVCDLLKLPKPDTRVTNEMLSQIPDIIKGFKYSCRWVEGDISSVYNNEHRNMFNSCMASKNPNLFSLYDDLQAADKLRMVEIVRGDDEHCGRALVWCGSNPDDMYLDRIYAFTENGHKVRAALNAVSEFCEQHGITKCVHSSVHEELGLEYRNLAMRMPFDLRRYDEFPYVDSMRYYFHDDMLRNKSTSPNSSLSFTMDQTDGTITDEDDEDYVTTSCGDRIREEDATYIERHGEYFHNCDCVYTHDDEHELRDDCTELASDYYGCDVWAHDSNCTYFHDLNESYHNDDIVELGDGSGEYWPAHLAVATPDGFYWRPTDDGIVEVDGVWVYWSDTQTQETATADEPVQI
jgi:hypothetical protein